MTKRFMGKGYLIALIGIILAGLGLSGCQVNPDNSQNGPQVSDVTAPDAGESKAAMTSYPYGVKKAGSDTISSLMSEYNTWKNNYVRESFAGYRVQRDFGSHYDTVSEGIGYGMLLAVYFNDKATFDQLWTYVQAHMIPSSGLMHWKVDNCDFNVSEFYIQVPHDKVWLDKSTWNKTYDDDRTYIASINNPGSGYLKASVYDRKLGSATDADEDIAAALVMASKRWNSTDYGFAAIAMIKAILLYDTLQGGSYDGFIRNGTLWGNQTCWNPSYFAPAWFKLYYQFITNSANDYNYHYAWYNSDPTPPSTYANRCLKVVNIMYQHMAYINNTSFTYNTGHGTISYRMVLPPDWVDTSSGSANVPNGSDRYYYIDDNRDGKIDNTNGTQGMSFNHYYDAIRVAWRMALDYSWTGDSRARTVANYIGNFFRGKVTTLVDGYFPFGWGWSRSNRDMFNNFLTNQNGGQFHSTAFVAMEGCAAMTLDQTYASQFYAEMKKLSEPLIVNGQENRFHYYGNTLRLLGLLYMSGNMVNLYQ